MGLVSLLVVCSSLLSLLGDTVDAKIEANTGADAEQLLKKKEQLKKQPGKEIKEFHKEHTSMGGAFS